MPKRFFTLVFLLTLSASSVFATKSSYELIQQAYQSGQLTTEDKLLMEVRSVKNHESLPLEFQSTAIEINKCATDILLQAQQSWNTFSASGQSALKILLARPTNTYAYDSPSGRFKIHYSTSGADAVPTTDVAPANGIPDFVEWLGNYADSSYIAEVLNLPSLEPPSDGVAGGDNKYDIYTEEMPYYGYTQSEGAGPNPWNDAYSYISVHRNFIGFPPNTDPDGNQKGAAKVTVAHEYYHAVQFAYNYTANIWFMEASSTWAEDYVFDPVNDNYNYLSDWFGHPDYSLHSTTDLHLYAAFIWPEYLTSNYGDGIMPQIWNQLISTTPYPAFTTVLAGQGTTLNAQFAEFCAWNFITGLRSDADHYREAAHYPLISTVRTHSTYPVSGQGPLSGKAPDAMGANYVVFTLPGGPGSLVIDFNGDNSTTWIVKILGWKSVSGDDIYQESSMTLNGNGDGSDTLTNPEDFTSAVMVICNTSQTLSDRTYSYAASFSSAPQYAVSVNAVADDSLYSNTAVSLKYFVQNIGVTGETFNLTVADKRGWNPAPSRTSVTLASGTSDSVRVTVTCPPLSMAGLLDTVLLTATATSTMGVSDTDTATALVLIQRGDADNSGGMDISDAVHLVSYIFSSGPAPVPVTVAGDANCDDAIDVSDCVFLIDYIFSSGPKPPCNPF